MKFLFDYIKRYKKTLWFALILAVVNQVFSLVNPQIFRIVTDRYASRVSEFTQPEFLEGIIFWTVIGVLAALISRLAKNFQDYYVSVITQKVGTDLYADSVKHAFSLPFFVFTDQRSGSLLSKFQKARTDSQALITSTINTVFLSLVGILIVLVYAFYVHPLAGTAFVVLIPTLGFAAWFTSRKIKKAQEEIVKASVELAGDTTESLRNVELVKSLGLETQEINHLNKTNDKILALELKKVKLVRTLSFIQGTLVNLFRSVLEVLLLWLIFTGDITLGEFFWRK